MSEIATRCYKLLLRAISPTPVLESRAGRFEVVRAFVVIVAILSTSCTLIVRVTFLIAVVWKRLKTGCDGKSQECIQK